MVWQKISTRLVLFSFVIVIGLGTTFYFILGKGVESTANQQLLQRQETLAKAQSSNLVSFFSVFGDSFAVFAQLRSMHRRDDTTISDMELFVEQWRDSGLIGGVVLTDKEGIVEFNVNVLGTKDVGHSLADRDYFLWAKNQVEEGVYYIGKPVISRIGATKGYPIVPVASPVIQDGAFEGVVVSSVKLNVLTQHYLELMTVSDATEVYLVDESGGMIYSNMLLKTIGANIFELLKEKPFSGSQVLVDKLKSVLNTKEAGSLQTSYLDPKTGEMMEYSMGYSPVLLDSQNWLLIISSPVEKIGEDNAPFLVRIKVMFLLISLTILLYGVVVYRETKKMNLNKLNS